MCESEASERGYSVEVIVDMEWLSWDKDKLGYDEWDWLLFLHYWK
jgi:hypothetical protein